MVDLSILRGWPWPCSMVHSSLMSTLNWSRLFFSDLFRDALQQQTHKNIHESVELQYRRNLGQSVLIYPVQAVHLSSKQKPKAHTLLERHSGIKTTKCKYETIWIRQIDRDRQTSLLIFREVPFGNPSDSGNAQLQVMLPYTCLKCRSATPINPERLTINLTECQHMT